MMNAKEQEYMDYLIHNRNQLTEQISRHLDDLLLLQNKLDIAVKSLKKINRNYRYEHSNDIAWKALKELKKMGEQ